MSYHTLHRHYEKSKELPADAIDVEPVVRGRVHATPRSDLGVPSAGTVRRFLFTCAQSNTYLHEATWGNLLALKQHYDAHLYVSTFTYDLASYGKQAVKRGRAKGSHETGEPWYDPRLAPYILDESVVVAPGLVWCGEMNILPTAVNPLAGFESYTGRKSGIFPHVKFAMASIASGKHEGTKFNYTTGTVTQRNYIAKTAGLKAEFHHGYGALLVEVDSDGNWFCRQLNADSEGTIHDLDLRIEGGAVTHGRRVEGITWGDIHVGTVPADVLRAYWGAGGVMDTLRSKYQFLHDVLDFRSRNHHDARDPHKTFRKHIEGTDNVCDELVQVADFISKTAYREWCQTVVVESNHDNAMQRWLKEGDYKTDPKNAVFFLKAQLRVYQAIQRRDKNFHLLKWTMHELLGYHNAIYLQADDSFILCPDANGGIECGMHGHLGPDGSRGNLRSFARMGRKSNTGHSHSAAIIDGAYRAGVTGALEQGYNAGPSSWSHSSILTYENGKRAVLTFWNGKWRA